MAKKAASVSDRTDPKKNKSLAIRMTIAKMPAAKLAEITSAVKEEYGHDVPASLFYALKAKKNMRANRRKANAKATKASPAAKQVAAPMNSAATWVVAIKYAKQLLQAAGSVENATALLKAVEG